MKEAGIPDEPLTIGFNLFNLMPQVGGLANYVMTLMRTWPIVHPEDRLIFFTFKQNEPLLTEMEESLWRPNQIRISDQGEIKAHARALHVYFCPFGALWPRPYPCPSAIMLVDIQERFFPDFFKAEDIGERLFHFDGSVRMTDQVITISEFSRQSIAAVIGAPLDRISAVFLCDDLLPDQDQRPAGLPLDWPGGFLLYPANDWIHKNHRGLIEAFAKIHQRHPQARLVMTGLQEDQFPLIRGSIDACGLSGHITHLGRVSRAELAWLYRHALALVFPSLFEGFGIPLVEAMRSGLPIACSNTSSLPEVARDAAIYFNPESKDEIAVAIERLLSEPSLRQQLTDRGHRRSRLFSARRMVEGHRDALKMAIQRYRTLRYLRLRCIDFPYSVLRRPYRIPPKQLDIARRLLGAAPPPFVPSDIRHG